MFRLIDKMSIDGLAPHPWAQLQSHRQRPTLHLSLSTLWFVQGLNVATTLGNRVAGGTTIAGIAGIASWWRWRWSERYLVECVLFNAPTAPV